MLTVLECARSTGKGTLAGNAARVGSIVAQPNANANNEKVKPSQVSLLAPSLTIRFANQSYNTCTYVHAHVYYI